MKRQQKYPDTTTFHYHNQNPKNRITGDCTIRAISLATGRPYEEVVMDLAQIQCETGYDATTGQGISLLMEGYGWVKHKQPKHDDGTRYRGYEFCELQQKYLNTGVLCTDGIHISKDIVCSIGSGHITAIHNGKVYDIWNCTYNCIGVYWTRDEWI